VVRPKLERSLRVLTPEPDRFAMEIVVMACEVEPNSRRGVLDQTSSSPRLHAPMMKLQRATRTAVRAENFLAEEERVESDEART